MIALLMCMFTALASPSTPLAELRDQADRVVIGEVLTTRTQREEHNAYTVATVRVWETLRGSADPIVEVRLPGAMLQDQVLTVYGQAKLYTGLEVLLFLQGDQVVSMGAGAFVLLGERAYRSGNPRMAPDPRTVGHHAESLYVSHEVDAVRAALQ